MSEDPLFVHPDFLPTLELGDRPALESEVPARLKEPLRLCVARGLMRLQHTFVVAGGGTLLLAAAGDRIAYLRTPAGEEALARIRMAPATVWHHGGRSYSADRVTPSMVSQEQHSVLQAFLDRDEALDTAALHHKVENAARVCGELARKFPGAVRAPGRAGKGAGYYVRVRSAAK
jgi:hypothetical protein